MKNGGKAKLRDRVKDRWDKEQKRGNSSEDNRRCVDKGLEENSKGRAGHKGCGHPGEGSGWEYNELFKTSHAFLNHLSFQKQIRKLPTNNAAFTTVLVQFSKLILYCAPE